MTVPGSANPLLLATAAGAGGYSIERSLRFNSSDSAYLSRTPASAGNRKTWTWAGWVKRSALGSVVSLIGVGTDSTNLDAFDFQDECLRFTRSTSGSFLTVKTTAVYRDPSAWFHVVLAVDTTQATSSNRVKIYVNGQQITVFSSASYPSQNEDTFFNTTNTHTIGRRNNSQSDYFSGLLADIHFCDGTAYDASAFGEFDANGIWQPKKFAGVYGTNGFKLNFSDNSTAAALGTDTSGNGNTWSVNNLSVTAGAGNDSLVDVPTNGSEVDTGSGGQVRGNYCTWNPVGSGSGATLTNGNLDYSLSGATVAIRQARGTFLIPTAGKWYWEHTVATVGETQIGVVDFQTGLSSNYYWYDVGGWQNIYINDVQVASVVGYTNGDVIGVGYDADNNQIRWYKNGTQVGTNYSLTNTGRFVPFVLHGSVSGSCSGSANFGQRPFAYTAPTGFKALNTANLPSPLVTKPSTVMDVKLWTGNGSSQTITTDFSPDFVWIKRRDAGANYHILTDTVRGSNKQLFSNDTIAEESRTDRITAFNSDGFTLGSYVDVNNSTYTYAGWCWDAGSSTVTNTQGSISSQVRANASAGFSVTTFTMGSGTYTVGHGLGATPSLLITKGRSFASGWWVYHSSLGSSQYLALNETSAASSLSWGGSPTSTVFTANNNFFSNGQNYVVYAFAPVAGYSSMGSYTGDGSTSGFGPFIHCGFRPKFVLIKGSSVAHDWLMLDAVRNPYNLTTQVLYANSSTAEMTNNGVGSGGYESIDILSNGFQIKSNSARYNQSGATYIYFAVAESPFQYARAR